MMVQTTTRTAGKTAAVLYAGIGRTGLVVLSHLRRRFPPEPWSILGIDRDPSRLETLPGESRLLLGSSRRGLTVQIGERLDRVFRTPPAPYSVVYLVGGAGGPDGDAFLECARVVREIAPSRTRLRGTLVLPDTPWSTEDLRVLAKLDREFHATPLGVGPFERLTLVSREGGHDEPVLRQAAALLAGDPKPDGIVLVDSLLIPELLRRAGCAETTGETEEDDELGRGMPVRVLPGAAPQQIPIAPEVSEQLVSVRLIRPDRSEKVVPLPEGTSFVGRLLGQPAELNFPTDDLLSPRHAEFRRVRQKVQVVDLESLNGVYLRVRESPLEDGVTILMGEQVFRFELVSPDAGDPPAPAGDGTRRLGSGTERTLAKLVKILEDGSDGPEFPLTAERCVIGRKRGHYVFPEDAYMSSRHARIVKREGKFWIEGHQASNGTFVRLTEPRDLEDGEILRIGRQTLRVRCAE